MMEMEIDGSIIGVDQTIGACYTLSHDYIGDECNGGFLVEVTEITLDIGYNRIVTLPATVALSDDQLFAVEEFIHDDVERSAAEYEMERQLDARDDY